MAMTPERRPHDAERLLVAYGVARRGRPGRSHRPPSQPQLDASSVDGQRVMEVRGHDLVPRHPRPKNSGPIRRGTPLVGGPLAGLLADLNDLLGQILDALNLGV